MRKQILVWSPRGPKRHQREKSIASHCNGLLCVTEQHIHLKAVPLDGLASGGVCGDAHITSRSGAGVSPPASLTKLLVLDQLRP